MGAEQLNYAIVDMDGIPRRRYYEMQETAALLKQLEPLAGAGFPSEVGILLNYDSHWALNIKPVNETEFTYLDFARKLYYNLECIGIHADVLSSDSRPADLAGYKALVLPASIILSEERARALKEYVASGGLLISTFLTSVKNEDNVGYTSPLPANMTEVFGVTVQEVEPVFETSRASLELQTPAVTGCLSMELFPMTPGAAFWGRMQYPEEVPLSPPITPGASCWPAKPPA